MTGIVLPRRRARIVAYGVLASVLALVLAPCADARTVIGTSRADRLIGTPGADLLRGRAGNDRIDGRGGRDRIYGGAGNDTIVASASSLVRGGPGRDQITLTGVKAGALRVDCGTGRDTLRLQVIQRPAQRPAGISGCEQVRYVVETGFGTTVPETSSSPTPTPSPPPSAYASALTPAPPSASFAYSPASPTTGQAVTFDASGSSCAATPCSYHWHDVGSSGSDDYPLGDGQRISFTFQNAGTKYVQLVLTDASGLTDNVTQAVNVASGAPPPPPPPPRPPPPPPPPRHCHVRDRGNHRNLGLTGTTSGTVLSTVTGGTTVTGVSMI
jgi:hypothetical protein